MIIYIQPEITTGESAFSIEVDLIQVDYDATIEDVLYHVSLKVTSIKVDRMELRFQGNQLLLTKRLNEYGIKEQDTIQLFENRAECCLLLQILVNYKKYTHRKRNEEFIEL